MNKTFLKQKKVKIPLVVLGILLMPVLVWPMFVYMIYKTLSDEYDDFVNKKKGK